MPVRLDLRIGRQLEVTDQYFIPRQFDFGLNRISRYFSQVKGSKGSIFRYAGNLRLELEKVAIEIDRTTRPGRAVC
jgi:hypothetical protein